MAFNGTKDFHENALVNDLEKEGIKFRAASNAYTRLNETVYEWPIPTHIVAKSHFETSVEIRRVLRMNE